MKNFADIVDSEKSQDKKKEGLEQLNEKVKELKEEYKVNVTFLTNHDVKNYLNLLDDLTKFYNDLKEKIYPKKKFAFSKKEKIKEEKSYLKEDEIGKNEEKREMQRNLQEDYVIKNVGKDKIVVTEEQLTGKNNLIIENVESCEIYILLNLKACYLKNIKNSKLMIGSVTGGTHITNCETSHVYMATHQLRIHETKHTHFNILVSSNPIIENCSGLVFSPLRLEYEIKQRVLESANLHSVKNKWDSVLDFKWHKKEKSPNFRIENDTEILKVNF